MRCFEDDGVCDFGVIVGGVWIWWIWFYIENKEYKLGEIKERKINCFLV